MKKIGFGTAFVLGNLLGATVVALCSPISGKERRHKITAFLEETTQDINEVEEGVKNVQRSLSNLARTAGELLPTFKKDMERTLADFKFQAEPRIQEINKSMARLENDLAGDQ